MNNNLLITFEILLVVVAPLLVLYLRGKWPLHMNIVCLLSIPVLWYPAYAPLHELSHIAATYLVGGKVIAYKLIPSFWLSEFGGAWIRSEGIKHSWQWLATAAAPYIFDIACVATGILTLRRGFSKNPLVVGFLFMLLCLRPAFDLVCEAIAFLSGDRGDFYHLESIVGRFMTWSFIVFSIGLSLLSIFIVLKRFVGFPETPSASANLPDRKRDTETA